MPRKTKAQLQAERLERAFTTKRRSRQERRDAGRARRETMPLAAHADLPTPSPGRDPIATLRSQESSREPGLVPLRYGRMAASPFAFLRGAAAVMAEDLGQSPNSGLRAQLCGDAHVANFGIFASPDRRLVFDLNDFDETLPGPFEWDVKRLAASVVVAGRFVGVKERRARQAAVAAAGAYRTTMRTLSKARTLDVWYARVDVDALVKQLRGTSLLREAKDARRASWRNTGDVAVSKFTEVVDGQRRFRSRPPLLVPVDESVRSGIVQSTAQLYAQYLATLPADRVMLLLRYSISGLAHKVVGVGSVGTRALVLLMESGDGEPLILQIKQANPSVLEPYAGPSEFDHSGKRVVVGQRLMQATGDPFLGWTRGSGDAPIDYYVRQLRDMKGSIDLTVLDADDLVLYGRLCGAVLARAHARAGDPSEIGGYLGSSTEFEDAIGAFASAYADRTEADHAALTSAIATGVVAAVTEA